MRSRSFYIGSVAALVLAASLSGAVLVAAAPPSVVYPPQELPLTFSHVAHLARQPALRCEHCHEQAVVSQSSLDVLMPQERACATCHAIDRGQPTGGDDPRQASGACVGCHPAYDPATGLVPRLRVPAPGIKFDHARHRAAGISCIDCHGDLRAQGVGLATVAQLPSMASCLGCHQAAASRNTCDTCHLAEGGGRLRTALSHGALVPRGGLFGDRHDAEFMRRHGTMARAKREYCAACHRDDECAECHAGTVKPMAFHGGDYVLLHSIDAQRNDPNCASCHRTQTFCVGCHARAGVSTDERLAEFRSGEPMRAFHPPGWMEGAGAGRHGLQARRNLSTCSSCHREDFCARCHSAERGTAQVNPHPPGWATSAACEAMASRAGRMCLRCHVEAVRPSCEPSLIRGR